MDKFSFLSAFNAKELEDIYKKYKENPLSIEVNTWRDFFLGFDFALESNSKETYSCDVNKSTQEATTLRLEKEFKVLKLIEAYQKRAHLFADTNPIRPRRKHTPSLEIENFGLKQEDLTLTFYAARVFFGEPLSLSEILERLKTIFCSKMGIEYAYIEDENKLEWIKDWLLKYKDTSKIFSHEKRIQFFEQINQTTFFEEFLHARFVGQKRFSIEGCESVVVALRELASYASKNQVQEMVFGMAHRGRLNVLHHLFEKPFSGICAEFEGREYEEDSFCGDVKYHLGASISKKTSQGKDIKLNLVPNPSHLEATNSVVQGITRAKIENEYQGNFSKVLPILIHGDASIAAQGVVYEGVQMSQLEGYRVGGTIHVIINNQLGFTTDYKEARSSTYCTDVAKVVQAPVIHVNADELEEVIKAFYFALDYRIKFGQDVFVDVLGYRKYGHNEGDEPRFTQANLYKLITNHKNIRELYEEKLKNIGILQGQKIEVIKSNYRDFLAKEYEKSKKIEKIKISNIYFDALANQTQIQKNNKLSLEKLKETGVKLFSSYKEKNAYPKSLKLLSNRKAVIQEGKKIDWAIAELMAYATLIEQGYKLRISGQDAKRGTFSHRHAVIKSQEEKEFNLLSELTNSNSQAAAGASIYNSLLSEYGVLGFDYGYAMASSSHTLNIWEAQFGDFSNGAQIIIDQYLSSAEDKWKIQNGLVLFLPHGYEGQGAEHSSARMERYLQLCAKDNMRVINPSTPANLFHFLRAQMQNPIKKPAVVFTPKSLLRHPLCVSTLEELAHEGFKEMIEEENINPKKITKLIFCSGKLYYDLIQKKEELNCQSVALVRIEQLYPMDEKKLEKIILNYSKEIDLIWAQEEPENMGAWSYILTNFRAFSWQLIAPEKSASPASGSQKRFLKNQKLVLDRCFA